MIRPFLLLPLLLAAQPATAAYLPLDAAVPGHADATVFDLARKIVTDLEPSAGGAASGETAIPVRHLVPGEGGRNPDSISLAQADIYPFRAEAHDWLLAVFTLGQTDDRAAPTVIAAVFDDRLRLVDAADVALAPRVDVERLPFRISPWNDAVVFASRYPTAYATSTERELVFFRNGRLQLIDRFLSTDSWECGLQQFESVTFGVPDTSGATFWPIIVTSRDVLEVDLTVTCDGQPGIPYDRVSTEIYRWDDAAQNYRPEPVPDTAS